ncbi:MAG: dockerin type I domain-containing protein [Lentimicrobium sp.]
MKAIIRIVSVMVILACSFAGMAQQADVVIDSPPSYTTGSLDYWYGKINAPDFSYRQFRNEFDGYWSNREKVKGSGYKQVARWLIHQEAYLNPDGSMRNPVEDIEHALTYTQMYANQTISGTWTYAGPDQTVGGRTTAIAFSPHNPQKVFVGAPLGGLWASDNGGASYYCMNTDNISALGVSAIAVHPNDPNIIYIGTGDRDSHKTTGIGIYKSVDGGLTWIPKPISAIHDKVVHKIYIHPGNPDIMTIVSNYGVYTTLNGGDTWTQKLVVNLKDAEQKPGDPYTIYAASGSGFYKSTDFGATWELKLSGIAHRIALGVTAANPQKVVMFTSLNSAFHHLYVSNNSGESFTLVNSTGIVNERQGGYNLDVIIDPLNENIMYAGMVNFYKSVNGGVTWVEQTPVYADDQHTFEFHPVTHRLFIGNDSGIWITDNGTSYTRSSNGLNISEPYRIDVAAQNPNHWIIGSQDASTFVTNGGPFYNSIGADGMTCRFDPTDANYVYGSSQYGFIARSTNGGLANSSFTGIAGENINGINQKGNFQTSFHLDYFNQNRMFAGMKDLWRSTNVKTADASNITWTNISNGAFGTVSTIEFIEQSKVNANIIYVFDDHQRIFRSDNALATTPVWTQLSNPGMNHGVRFTTHPTQENTIYIVSGNYIYKSVDKGDTWVNLTANLTALKKMSIVYMNGSNEGLYVGTTAGIYYKDADMTQWVPFKTGLPLTQVRAMVINYSTTPAQLFAATFGRGVWKTNVTTSYRPDLVAGNGSATVNGTIVSCNNGILNAESNVAVSGCEVGYYLSTDNTFNTSDYLIGTAILPQMAPGIMAQAQLPSTDVALIQPEIPAGTYYVGMLVDHQNEIIETNEANNQWVSPNMVTLPANPGAPVNVQATDGTYFDRTTITWENNTGEPLYYAVFRHTSNIILFPERISPAVWQTATSFDDYTGTSGQTYYYWVRSSRYPDGRRSSALSAYNTGWRKLEAPANVQATDGLYSDRVTITWEPSPGADYYQVYKEFTPGFLECITGPYWLPFSGNYSFDDTNAETGISYNYYVKAAITVAGGRASELSEGDSGWKTFTNAPTASATDGTYTNRVAINWDAVPAATHYAVFRSTLSLPFNSVNISGWQTAISYEDLTASTGVVYNYWIKAANNPNGTNSTGFGPKDWGFRNFVPPTSVTASDGTSTAYTLVSWASPAGSPWSKVYRSLTSSTDDAIPVSNWLSANSFMDATGVPGELYHYFVRAAGSDTLVIISGFSGFNRGYRRIDAPVVTTSHGIYPEKVIINWEEATGAFYYRIGRSTLENPAVVTDLTSWSNTLNYAFEDLTAVQGQYYNYYVTGAVGSTGTRAGNTGSAIGLADGCGNYIDIPGYRTVYFHGTTLDITGRIVNEGPFARTLPGQIALALELGLPDGSPECFLGTIDVPPLNAGSSFDYSFTIDLADVEGWGSDYGQTWYVACHTSWDNTNCDSDPFDDYITWNELPFYYNDALFGIYSVGPGASDFQNLGAVVEALHTRGISDHVFFHLKPVLYQEKIELNQITGSAANRLITFRTDPAFSTKAEIRGTPSEDANFTLKLSNSSYLRFENLHLSTAGYSNFQSTYGRVVEIGDGCNNITIDNNLITANTDASFGNGDNIAIHAGNATINGLTISNNEIRYGEMSIKLYGGNTPENYIQNLVISGNQCSDFQITGMMLEKVSNLNVTGNLVTQHSAAFTELNGFYFIDISNEFQINANQISLSRNDVIVRGMIMQNINVDAQQPGLISNNFISLGGQQSLVYGLYIFIFDNIRILHNSINLYGTAGAFSTALLFDCQAGPTMLNNTFLNNIANNGLGGYCMIYNENAVARNLFSNCNYNNLRTTGAWFGMLANNNLESLATWNAATGFDANSYSVDPEFVSATNLHTSSQVLNNKGTACPEVTTDIDYEPRSSTAPDIGADEYTLTPADKILTFNALLEGLYAGPGLMHQALSESGPMFGPGIADVVRIEIHSGTNYNNILYASGDIQVNTDGTASTTLPGTLDGFHYITLKHRNSIAVTTSGRANLSHSSISANFTNPSRVYGNNLKLMPGGSYVIYGGDVNQDGSVDTADMTPVDNDASAFATGYRATDVNGDGTVDTGDMTIIDNNAAGFVSSITP